MKFDVAKTIGFEQRGLAGAIKRHVPGRPERRWKADPMRAHQRHRGKGKGMIRRLVEVGIPPHRPDPARMQQAVQFGQCRLGLQPVESRSANRQIEWPLHPGAGKRGADQLYGVAGEPVVKEGDKVGIGFDRHIATRRALQQCRGRQPAARANLEDRRRLSDCGKQRVVHFGGIVGPGGVIPRRPGPESRPPVLARQLGRGAGNGLIVSCHRADYSFSLAARNQVRPTTS